MDFDSWLAGLRDTVTRAQERMEQARTAHAALVARGHCPDRTVVATMDHRGRLTRLDIDAHRVRDSDPTELGHDIVTAHNDGRRQLHREQRRVLDETFERN